MGTKEIRTALKVDLNRPAKDQPGLHVRTHRLQYNTYLNTNPTLLEPLASR